MTRRAPSPFVFVPFLVPALLAAAAFAQGPPPNGARSADADWFALTGARVVTAPGAVQANATVVLRDGRITAVGNVPVPAGATTIDCAGLTIYPGLIEPFYASDVPALDPATTGPHWNPMVPAQRN